MNTTLRQFTAVWPLVIFLLLPALTRAETAVQAWVQHYDGPGQGFDEATALAVDGSNSVVVAGVSWGGFNYACATIKYSSAGVPLWTNRYNGPGISYQQGWAVVVDGDNNVIVAGSSADNYATIKYSSEGVPLWTNRYKGPGNGTDGDAPSSLAVDGSNNVIVTGYSYGSGSSGDYATIKYSSAGVPLWTNRYNGLANSSDGATAVVVDGSNDVIVTGSSVGSGSDYDYATIKYSSAGVPLWTNRYNGPGNYTDSAVAMAVDGSNNVIVTGRSYQSHSSFSHDYATIKYSSEGVPLWTNRYNGTGSGQDEAMAVAVDHSNNVIVTGRSSRTTGIPYNYDCATIKYSSGGSPLWTNRYKGPLDLASGATALAVDGSDDVIVTGYSGSDYATIKYSSAGVPLWTNSYTNTAYPFAAVTADRNGNVIVAGSAMGNGYDFVTLKYICVPSPVMTGHQQTNGTFQLRVDGVLQPGTLVIEASTNLTSWVPLFTNTTPTNVLFYAAPNADDSPTRFYRVFQFP